MTAVAEQPQHPGSGRPGWSLSGAEVLDELDRLHAAQTRLSARRLELLHRLDALGHARDLGARDSVELLSLRHRLDPQAVRRDLKAANALPRHLVLAAQLPGYPAPVGVDPEEMSAAHPDARSRVEFTEQDDLTDVASTTAAATATVGGAGEGEGADPLAVLVDRRRAAQAREVVLNPAQAAVIAETLAKVPAQVPAADLVIAETELVIAARTLLPRDLRRLGRAVVDRLDTDGPAPADATADEQMADDAAQAAQSLWFTPGSVTSPTASARRVKGLRFGGFLTSDNAELFQTLIDAAAKPRKTPTGELDPRTLGQRRADALSTVLRAAASTGGEIPAHGGIKPHLSITIPYTTLTTLTADSPLTLASRAPAAPAAPASALITPTPPPSTPTGLGLARVGNTASTAGELFFTDPLSARDVRRIACDAGVIPIVLGSQSEPLDVGREQRLVTPAIRRALIARDGGCVIPGCDAPPGHCDAHHLVHWIDGGITAVSNLALVCTPHHRAIHRGVWTVTIVDGEVRITRPTWTESGPSG